MKIIRSELSISNWRIEMRLGITEQERQTPQPVSVDFEFEFTKYPAACQSDAIEETLCYDLVLKKALTAVKDRPFNTIEAVAWTLLKSFDSPDSQVPLKPFTISKIRVRVTKLNPPIDLLKGGATFLLEAVP